jgi:TRAP transporter TAXI family solute receptor
VAGRAPNRREVLRAGGLLGLLAGLTTALPACSAPFAGRRLVLATGATQGVYYNLGTALAQLWQHDLGLDVAPEVRSTAGSVDNLLQLDAGKADVVISQIDAAARQLAQLPLDDPRSPRALARIYDDVVHLVVPAASPVTAPVQLRGLRVSTGAPESGVSLVAQRMLEVTGLVAGTDLSAEHLGITESADALRAGRLDAFFWVGGLPTQGITDLAAAMPIRLVDLKAIIGPARAAYPEYAAVTVPAMSYGVPEPSTSLRVRNVLLVTADMPDDLAGALARSLLGGQETLARTSPAALTIDPRSAIGTQPVPLHPGAEAFYRASKDD